MGDSGHDASTLDEQYQARIRHAGVGIAPRLVRKVRSRMSLQSIAGPPRRSLRGRLPHPPSPPQRSSAASNASALAPRPGPVRHLGRPSQVLRRLTAVSPQRRYSAAHLMHKADGVATERRSGRTPGIESGRKYSAICAGQAHVAFPPTAAR